MTKLHKVVPITAALLVGGQASAEVIWSGDFETGDLSQWDKVEAVSPDRLEVVADPVTNGNYALKATVHQGDNPINASGNRNELAFKSFEPSGTERYYRWQTMFAPDYPSEDTWQLFTQFHHIGPNGSPPVQFCVRGDLIILSVDQKRVWTMPLERGRWIDFVFHVKWSSDPSEGFVELWVDGEKVLEKTPARTQFPGEVNYLKQGLYRDDKIQGVGVVYHDGTTVATELADVLPEAETAEAEQGVSGDEIAPEEMPQITGTGPNGEMTLQDFEQAYANGGCSAAPGAPLVGGVFALAALLRRRRRG